MNRMARAALRSTQQSLLSPEAAALLNTVGKAAPAKAKLDHNRVVKAARLVRLAVMRSGIQQKALGPDKAQISKKLDGTSPEKLWFHEMLTEWPPEVWRELLPLIALEVCAGQFVVERALTIREEGRR